MAAQAEVLESKSLAQNAVGGILPKAVDTRHRVRADRELGEDPGPHGVVRLDRRERGGSFSEEGALILQSGYEPPKSPDGK